MSKKRKITTTEMEFLVAGYLNYRSNLIVPNVHWGMGLHECDLLACTKAGRLWEVEIKISKSDLIKDKEKRHQHLSPKISRLYFAIPEYLQDEIEHVPERAGVLVVCWHERRQAWMVKKHREAKRSKLSAYKVSEKERFQLARLGALRIWGLKQKVCRLKSES